MNPTKASTLLCALMFLGCGKARIDDGRPIDPEAKNVNADQLIAETNALVGRLEHRVAAHEADLIASMASEQLSVLTLRASRLKERCELIDTRPRMTCDAHFSTITRLQATTGLA